jgi:hypothetical protein
MFRFRCHMTGQWDTSNPKSPPTHAKKLWPEQRWFAAPLMGEGGEEGRRTRAKARDMMAVCRRAVGDGGSSVLTLKRLCDEIIGPVVAAHH